MIPLFRGHPNLPGHLLALLKHLVESKNVYYKMVTEENMDWLCLGHRHKPFGVVLPTTL